MNEMEEPATGFSMEVGRRLRAVRKAKKMSLEEVERSSGGRWSASAIGAYERGFRNLSLPRLRELAEFYSVPMVVLLGESGSAAASAGGDSGASPDSGSPKVVVDLEKLGSVSEATPIMRYLRTIILERGDFNGRVLSIRRDDLRALCAVQRVTEPELFESLRAWGVLVAARSPGVG